ncbi:SAM-dependent methyltransferase, MidA family [Monaibacterium marinum]|uniref:SAM-dependent methyltransferase, MidA family n=1 Tax=Pontivivens marinum TaxID=1690039 RepID=A0A2C9CS63_9RHOB|nr:SAM-dependent methyltransferase [Monaibacterium marinum]SOH94184.1 SAM-dependent methyltransferase, MidA family [Monaibacterium marinum]
MSALGDILKRQIALSGPLSVAEYMTLCLQHPQHGYYITRDPFGAAGDFTTAPEISQMFGEMFGLALAQIWLDQGAGPVSLVEAGPGRGTLMADILRSTARVPGFHDAASVHLVETSPVLRARQREALGTHPVTWHDSVADLPDGPMLFIANEFFDALPIRQFVRQGRGWAERCVGLVEGELSFGLKPATAQPVLDDLFADVAPDTLVEWCPAAAPIMGEVANRLRHGGAALIIDYGSYDGTGDTLQALSAQTTVDPLTIPGDADLTAHVNFGHLARAAGLRHGIEDQGAFLELLGITARAQQLSARDPSVVAAHRRLTHPQEMGTLFKVLGISAGSQPLPAFRNFTLKGT